MGGCGGWSAVPFFCLKPDFFSQLSFKFQSFTRSSDGAFVICFVCVVCVVARGFGANLNGGSLPRGAQPSEPKCLSEGRRGGGIGH